MCIAAILYNDSKQEFDFLWGDNSVTENRLVLRGVFQRDFSMLIWFVKFLIGRSNNVYDRGQTDDYH